MSLVRNYKIELFKLLHQLISKEYEIDKKLGIKSPKDVLDMGIDKYNAECRKIVMRYAAEWEVGFYFPLLEYLLRTEQCVFNKGNCDKIGKVD